MNGKNYILRLDFRYYERQDWFTGELFTTTDESKAYVFSYYNYAKHVQETLQKKKKINFEIIEI